MSVLDGARIVPVLRCPSAAEAVLAGTALVGRGFTTVEVALTTPGALDAIAELAALDGATVGAGTVLVPTAVKDAAAAGARFAVSPGCLPELVGAADIEVVLGAATPTEVALARRAGSPVVKLFPARPLGGPDYLRALRGPFPDLRAFPTGGITVADVDAWLAAGSVAVGIGSGRLL